LHKPSATRQTAHSHQGSLIVCLVIAFKDNCGVHVGWSVCRKTDVYDKDMAETIAKARACEGTKVAPPRFALQQLAEFNERAMNYFNNPNPKPKREKQKA
jgi:hypothetical protein